MIIRFDSSKYEWVHGKKPRGYGWWAFRAEANGKCKGFFAMETFAEAKKICRQEIMKDEEIKSSLVTVEVLI